MKTVDPIIDTDLDAYVDGELSVARRVEVESYLSERPEIAAKVMADMSIRGELRMALAGESHVLRAETREAARRLERGLVYGRMLASFQRVAAVAVLVASGWVAHTSFGAFTASEVSASTRPPAFVDDAVQAYKTTAMREEIKPQSAATNYNPEEIRASTAIVLPELPGDWRVTDAQIYPSEFGPSVEMMVDAGKDGHLSLFAVRPGSFAVKDVSHIKRDDVQAAYWQIGEVAYALIGNGQAAQLDGDAEKLARSLY
ncbi:MULTISPECIES: anti-sigma factor [unclassified Rhizobium]|jgi:anti-sigma factor RsiW|uniref:anti-sigma factor family protein n=1 Tax=unclassified Rhizobium TaxID=2613769 RepID=UPI0008290DCE|nr:MULTISPECIES: anti-sigma factor [unclassified Rhizobium]OCJ03528.1 Fis family transcriptional regulator [Rhizobium sp. AC27/96]TIX91583.1 anti-sigma factor [Rhizobium sp. P44RR-XXIV]